MQSNSVNGQPDIANITVVTDERQVIVPQAITSVVEVNNPGPQGPTGPQGPAGPSEPFVNIGNGVYATTSSLQVTGSFLVSGSSTFTNIGPAIFSGSVNATSGVTMSSALVSGNVTVLGTASINVLQINTTINSTGSNQLGDAPNDTQTLYGSVVIPTGSLTVSGSTGVNGTLTVNNKLSVFSNPSGTFLYSAEELFIGTSVNRRLAFFINSLEAMRIAPTTRNLLIGTTIDAGAKLHISGSTSEALLVASSSAGPALFVSGSGNIGIGTASPTQTLDVNGTARIVTSLAVTTGKTFSAYTSGNPNDALKLELTGAGAVLGVQNSNASGFSGVEYLNNFGSPRVFTGFNNSNGQEFRFNNFATGGYIDFLINYTSGLRIANTRNILIGTTTDSGYKLDVSGSAQFYKTTSDYIQLLQDANSITFSPNAASYLKYGANTILSMKSGGSNSTLVHGAGTAILAATSTGVSIRSNVDGTAATSMLQVRGSGATSATTALRIENSSATPSLVVLDNGFVGIGTSSAQYQLDVYGTYHQYQAQGQIARYDISSANANQNRGVWDFFTNAAVTPDFFGRFGFKFEGGTADSFKQFQVHVADSTTPKFVVDGSGRMGIGTIVPSAQLHISGASNLGLLEIDSPSVNNILYVSGSGQVGIGTSSPSSSILLDVSGSIRSFNILPAANGSYDLGISANRFRNGWFAGSLVAPSGYFNNLLFGVTNFGIYNSIGTQLAQMFGTGDLVLQNGGTFTNNNYRLQVNATGSNSGSLFLGGTTIATGSIARTMLISSSLSASANNDVLVGLDINPSFNAGSFTGVERTAIRFGTIKIGLTPAGQDRIDFGNQVNISRNNGEAILTATTTQTFLSSRSSAAYVAFALNQGITEVGRFAATTGNFLINTTTDAGFKLDVNGTARLSDTLSFTNNSSLSPQGTTAADRRLLIRGGEGGAVGSTSLITLTTNGNITSTSGNPVLVNISRDFTPTSGTATYTLASITGVINQTGGANGITRGLYIQPTLTSAADFRAIETTAGNVLFQSGSTPLLFVSGSGRVGIGTNTPAYNLHVTDSIAAGVANSTNGTIRIERSSGAVGLIIRGSDGNIVGGGFTPVYEPYKYADASHNFNIGHASIGNYNWYAGSNATLNLNTHLMRLTRGGNLLIGTTTDSARLAVRGSGATSATTTFLLQNSTPTNLLSVLDNGQVSFTSPTMSLAASQSAFSISPIISASNIVGGQYYGVNITPTFFQTTGSQTETAFRVAATFTASNAAAATGGTNVIADFGSTSAGSQLTVTDVTSGSIYMVNDVSGIPIIEATSNWDVNIYDFPNKVFEKTGSQVNIYGTMRVSGSFILPLSQSVAPQTGSAYWSGSLLFIYDGTRYRSSSFA